MPKTRNNDDRSSDMALLKVVRGAHHSELDLMDLPQRLQAPGSILER